MQKYFYCLLVMILCGCSITNLQDKWEPFYRLQAGLNHGGIVENTDFKSLPTMPTDAFSGATKISFNAGGHVMLPVLGNSVETGLDFMHSSQTFTFNPNVIQYKGTRDIGTSQLMIPLTIDLALYKDEEQPLGALQLKFGYIGQFNFFSVTDKGFLPPYSNKSYSGGMLFGISATPFKLPLGNRIGFYLDLYRGTKIYDDSYNNDTFEMPGSSFAKFGVIYQF
jgi:hypothetical protein